MYCSNCGIVLKDGVSFCPNCGKPVKEGNANIERNMNVDTSQNINSDINSSFMQNYPYTPTQLTSNTKSIKIIAIVGCSLAILGIFLPFVNVSVFGVGIGRSFYQMASIDFLILLAIAIIGLVGSIREIYKIPAIAGAAYGTLLYIDTYGYFQKVNDVGSLANNGIGFYCMALGVVVMFVSGIIGTILKAKLKKQTLDNSTGFSFVQNANGANYYAADTKKRKNMIVSVSIIAFLAVVAVGLWIYFRDSSTTSSSSQYSNSYPKDNSPITTTAPVKEAKSENTYNACSIEENGIGGHYCYAIVEVLNTGTADLYLNKGTYDLEDNDGHLLQTRKLDHCPEIIRPGEKGYFYSDVGSLSVDASVPLDNGLKLKYNTSLVIADSEPINYEISDLDLRESNFEKKPKVTGRIENTTSKDASWVMIYVIFYDSDEKPLGITNTYLTELKAGEKKSFEISSIYLSKNVTCDKIASYKVIAQERHYQY